MGKDNIENAAADIAHAKKNGSFDVQAVDHILAANNLTQNADSMKNAGAQLQKNGVLPGLILDESRRTEFSYLADKTGHLDMNKVEEAARTGVVDGHHLSATGQFVAEAISDHRNEIDTKGTGIGQNELNAWASRDSQGATFTAQSADNNRFYAGGSSTFDEGRLQPLPGNGPPEGPHMQPQPELPPPQHWSLKPNPEQPSSEGGKKPETGNPGAHNPVASWFENILNKLPGTHKVFDPVRPPGIDDSGGFNAGGHDKKYDIDNRTVRSHPDPRTGGTDYSYDGSLTDKGKNGEKVRFHSDVQVQPDGRIKHSETTYDPPMDQTYTGEGVSHDRHVIIDGENDFTIKNVKKVTTDLGPDGETYTKIETADGKEYSMRTDKDGKVTRANEDNHNIHLY